MGAAGLEALEPALKQTRGAPRPAAAVVPSAASPLAAGGVSTEMGVGVDVRTVQHLLKLQHDRFDIPSVTEIAAAVANLMMGKKTGKKISAVGGGRGRKTTEQKFPEVFGPLWAEWTAGREQTVGKACSWLNQHKHGQISGSWPQELGWPDKQKTHVAAALKRCSESERAHNAVDASLQRVHGQVAELGRERSSLQSELRRLNNRYVALATSHARLQAACGQMSAPSEQPAADPPPKDNSIGHTSGKGTAECKLTMETRRVVNRHARQHIVPPGAASSTSSGATGEVARKTAIQPTAGSSGVGEKKEHRAMSLNEQLLYRQRLRQANITIKKLKAQVHIRG